MIINLCSTNAVNDTDDVLGKYMALEEHHTSFKKTGLTLWSKTYSYFFAAEST